MESKEFYKKLQDSIYHLYYYIFYNYNPSKISTFLLSLMDIFQLFSINLNERVNLIFKFHRILFFGKIIQKYLIILLNLL